MARLMKARLSGGRQPNQPAGRTLSSKVRTRRSNTRPVTAIAIDFGATYSANAYARDLDPEIFEREDVLLDPLRVESQFKYDNFKTYKQRTEVPSISAYDRETGQAYFGLEVDWALKHGKITKDDKLELLKLFIPQRNTLSPKLREKLSNVNRRIDKIRRLDPVTGQRATTRPSLEELISDCLRSLWNDAIWHINTISVHKPLDPLDLRLILTIPAIWDISEENIMRKAAQLGGLPSPVFISEPEGAGHLFVAESREVMDVNDIFLMCDAGGGTTDSISYLLSKIFPLHVQEFVTGSGDTCGSSNLNEELRGMLDSLLVDVLPSILIDMDRSKEEFYDMIIKEFEEKKKDYSAFRFLDGEIFLEIPGIKRREARYVTLNKDEMILTKETALAIFQPTMIRNCELIKNQIEECHAEMQRNSTGLLPSEMKVKYIVLVGGLGANPHFLDYLEQQFTKDSIMGYSIPIVFPNNPSAAIARGAVLREANRSVISVRRSRLSFGFLQHDLFDPKFHKNCKPHFDIHDNLNYAHNRIHFVIWRNEAIPRKGFSRIWISRRTIDISDDDFEIHQALYGCRYYVQDGICLNGPKGKHVFELGRLKADMSACPYWRSFKRIRVQIDDEVHEALEFEYVLRIKVEESDMIWEMLIPPRGILPEGESDSWDFSGWYCKRAELINLRHYIN